MTQENYKKINGYYFGGMIADDPTEIWDSLVEDSNEKIREELPKDILDEFDSGEGDHAYEYIMEHMQPIYIKVEQD